MSEIILPAKTIIRPKKKEIISLKDSIHQPRFYSDRLADKAVNFIKLLKHTKGEHAGRRFGLQHWQEDGILRPLFGTVYEDGTRVYRTAYLSTGRKNGKTELGAGIALFMLFADNEPAAEVYSCAGDKEQASTIFNAGKTMVESNKALRKKCRIIESQKRIYVPKTNSFWRVLSADARLKHGFNASAVFYDELHVAKDSELWDVLSTSMGARRQPLMVAMTTAGFDLTTICGQQYTRAKDKLKGTIDAPTVFSYIAEAGEKDDWADPATWRKANPNLGISISVKYIQEKYEEAKDNPAKENTFRRLTLNQWTSSESKWIPDHVWQLGNKPVNPVYLKGRPCFGGLDLASTDDLAAFVLLFPFYKDGKDEAGKKTRVIDFIKMLPTFWIPKDNARERSKKHDVNYEAWIKQGYVKATEGNVIDYQFIKQHIIETSKIYNIRDIAYDRWGAQMLVQALTDEKITVVPMGMGFVSLAGPTKEFETFLRRGQLHHGNNPVLNWMIANTTVQQDAAGNIKPSKEKSKKKIDGIMAGVMATDRVSRNPERQSKYEIDELRSY